MRVSSSSIRPSSSACSSQIRRITAIIRPRSSSPISATRTCASAAAATASSTVWKTP